MLRGPRALAAGMAIFWATACDLGADHPDCSWSPTVVPVRQDPGGNYAGNAVGCTGDLGFVCDHAEHTGWTSYARENCGRTELHVCTDNFASGHCIDLLFAEEADAAVAQFHRF